MIADTRTGELREVKMVTGVDDHSRFCVIAAVTERVTSRGVCLALAAALARHGPADGRSIVGAANCNRHCNQRDAGHPQRERMPSS
jgi:hypothetical protein